MGGIKSTGMGGFSEAGEPSDWDMAIGEIYGYRWWKIEIPADLAGYRTAGISSIPSQRLVGANAHGWNAGKLEAECKAARSHMPPSWDELITGVKPLVHEPPEYRVACGCGFWAYFDKNIEVDSVLGGMNGRRPELSYGRGTAWVPVFGVIKGTGRVIIGTKGFRCQYAEIAGLCVPDVAKEQLSWEITGMPGRDRNYHTIRGLFHYGYSSSGSYDIYGNPVDCPDVVHPAHESERLRRFATLEAILSVQYPDAKVFSDQKNLVRYFPPDPHYT